MQRSRVRILVPPSLVAMSSRLIPLNDPKRDHVMVPIQYIDIVVIIIIKSRIANNLINY